MLNKRSKQIVKKAGKGVVQYIGFPYIYGHKSFINVFE